MELNKKYFEPPRFRIEDYLTAINRMILLSVYFLYFAPILVFLPIIALIITLFTNFYTLKHFSTSYYFNFSIIDKAIEQLLISITIVSFFNNIMYWLTLFLWDTHVKKI